MARAAMGSSSFRVGAYARDSHLADWVPVFDGVGWCRGLARTQEGAEALRDALEAGEVTSSVLEPVHWEW